MDRLRKLLLAYLRVSYWSQHTLVLLLVITRQNITEIFYLSKTILMTAESSKYIKPFYIFYISAHIPHA